MTSPAHAGEAHDELARRRRRRQAAQQRFDILATGYTCLAGVDRGRMFGSDGLTYNRRFVAFVGRDGRLIVKLPAAQAPAMVARGKADHIRAGRAVTREWVAVPMSDQGEDDQWPGLIVEALRYSAEAASAE